MKKIACLFMTVSLILSNTLTANAFTLVKTLIEGQWTEYPLEEMSASVYLPADYITYTRGMDASNPVLVNADLTPKQIDQIFMEGSIYLEATCDDFQSEIMVTMIENEIESFSNWSNGSLLSLAMFMKSGFQQYGLEILDYDVFLNNSVKYIRMHECQTENDGTVSAYRMQYYTIMNHLAINFVFISTYDEITDEEKTFMQEVVEKIIFHDGDEKETADDGNSQGGSKNESGLVAKEKLRTYMLPAGPITVTLDENKYNIFCQGMTKNDLSIIRSGDDAQAINDYLDINNKDMVIVNMDETIPAEFSISIRIKDQTYKDVDLRNCSFDTAKMALDIIYSSFEDTGTATDKEIVVINNVPYLKFRWMNNSQLRYATIINGDMIYIWASHKDSGIVDADAEMLLQVVKSIQYPDK